MLKDTQLQVARGLFLNDSLNDVPNRHGGQHDEDQWDQQGHESGKLINIAGWNDRIDYVLKEFRY